MLTADTITDEQIRAGRTDDIEAMNACDTALSAGVGSSDRTAARAHIADLINASAAGSPCCNEPLDACGICAGCGESPKVRALIAKADATWTEDDYLELALAALDQAGASVSLQRRVDKLVCDELAERDRNDASLTCAEDE